ncbi:MAG TPA: AAA family ATPase [Thermoanaerobaculia bacterium]|nr:AAA family ATPase [Thermoanaerobaculia bacterium]
MRSIHFPPYRLDLGQQRLWRGPEEIVLRAKTFAVLRYLAERPGQLVTKEELLENLWPDLYVCDVAPMVCVSEIRKALGGTSEPELIATVHRRGYRFIAPVAEPGGEASGAEEPTRLAPASLVPDREEELSRLEACLDRARRGERQVFLVSGALGLGKTALLEEFRRRIERSRSASVAMGRCLDLRGKTGDCAPLAEALGLLGQEPERRELLGLVGRYAPGWLLRTPWLFEGEGGRRALERTARRMTPDWSPWGIAQALETFARRSPLVLMLEDLHWSDPATLDLLSILAQGRGPARLLLVGTCRPEAASSLERELRLHGLCREERLRPLELAGVSAFLRSRLGGEIPGSLVEGLLHRTGGVPLFLVALVDGLVQQRWIVREKGGWTLQRPRDARFPIPESLDRIVAGEIERLSAKERTILETASVAGEEFSAAEVAAGRGEALVEIDETCAELARHGRFLTLRGEESGFGGTLSGRYAFSPPLLRDVLRDRVPPASWSQIQSRIAGHRKATPLDRTIAAAGRPAAVLQIPPRKENR